MDFIDRRKCGKCGQARFPFSAGGGGAVCESVNFSFHSKKEAAW